MHARFKPDVLKKSADRPLNYESLKILYSFGYQHQLGPNIAFINDETIIVVAGNFLNFYNIETSEESFLPSEKGIGFLSVTVHPSLKYFAASEWDSKFFVQVFSYPELKKESILKHDTSKLPCRVMKYHSNGELLVTLSSHPENKVIIWLWAEEVMLYDAREQSVPAYDLSFSKFDPDIFVTSGKHYVKFWHTTSKRNMSKKITEIEVYAKKSQERTDFYCTVAISKLLYLSSTGHGYILVWRAVHESYQPTKLLIRENQPCHSGRISCIVPFEEYFLTLGSDGKVKFWSQQAIIEEFTATETSEDNSYLPKDREFIFITPLKEVEVSVKSDFTFAIVYKDASEKKLLLQDLNGCLWKLNIEDDFSLSYSHFLLGCDTFMDIAICPIYPLIAAASSKGIVIVYDCIKKDVFGCCNFSVASTSVIWVDQEIDDTCSSIIVGFSDGSIRWLSLVEGKSELCLKFVVKLHSDYIVCMKISERSKILVTQGHDEKLFFCSIERYKLIPMGFYTNRHPVKDMVLVNNLMGHERLLLICKYNYIVELELPLMDSFKEANEETYVIESEKAQVYTINGLKEYYKLGDKVLDDDEELSSLSEEERKVKRRLKYDTKREEKERKRAELGLKGPSYPSEILCNLQSINRDCLWFSFEKDFGHLFEFQFFEPFTDGPMNLIPISVLEILIAESVSVLSMCYSPCGKFLFMGLEDGSLTVCHLKKAFIPSSGYEFIKYQIHDANFGPVNFLKVSSDGSLIVTGGKDGNLFLFSFNVQECKTVIDYEQKPMLTSTDEVEDLFSGELSVEDKLLDKKYRKHCYIKQEIFEALKKLKDSYAEIQQKYKTFLEVGTLSLKSMKTFPDELKISFEDSSSKPFEAFYEKVKYELLSLENTFCFYVENAHLMKESYWNFFKSKVEDEQLIIELDSKKRMLQNFRGCSLPQNLMNFSPILPQNIFQVNQKESAEIEKKMKIDKQNEEQELWKKELVALKSQVIEFPGDTPISDNIFRYNRRKQERINILQEHISLLRRLEDKLSKSMYGNASTEIDALLFKFKENGLPEQHSTSVYTFNKHKEKFILVLEKIHKLWKLFNPWITEYCCVNKKAVNSCVENDISGKESNENCRHGCMEPKKFHISFKYTHTDVKQLPKIEWIAPLNMVQIFDEKNAGVNLKSIESEYKEVLKQKMSISMQHFLSTTKLRMNCEKKFLEMRSYVKCVELNLLKDAYSHQKKWITIMNELEEILATEKKEFSDIKGELYFHKEMQVQESEKLGELWRELQKVIDQDPKYENYFKSLFKKKVTTEEEKKTSEDQSSSESSEENNIKDIDPNKVDQNLLTEVMLLRMKRQDVDNSTKKLKRQVRQLNMKESAIKKRIEKINEAMCQVVGEINIVQDQGKNGLVNLNWPIILYPENIHSEYINTQQISAAEQKEIILSEMSKISENILTQSALINNYVDAAVNALANAIASIEINDYIDVFILIEFVVEEISRSPEKYFVPNVFSEHNVENEDEKIFITENKQMQQNSEELLYKEELRSEPSDEVHEKRCEISGLADGGTKQEVSKTGLRKKSELMKIFFKKSFNIFRDILSLSSEPEIKVIDENSLEDVSFHQKMANQSSDACTLFPSEKELETDLNAFMNYLNEIKDKCVIYSVSRDPFDDTNVSVQRKTCVTESSSSNETKMEGLLFIDFGSLLFPDSGFDYYIWAFKNEDNKYIIKLKEDSRLFSSAKHKIQNPESMEQKLISRLLEDLWAGKEHSIVFQENDKPNNPEFRILKGGGLCVSLSTLRELQNEDPISFPYPYFYQKFEQYAEVAEKPQSINISIVREREISNFYHIPSRSMSDFLIVDVRNVTGRLQSFNAIRDSTNELQHEIRLLPKKIDKLRRNLIYKQEEINRVHREKANEMMLKFGKHLDLELLQDIIDNPHFRIKKYEAEKHIESLQKELKKIKVLENKTFKSLDKLRFEDTKLCYELIELREEHKMLNKCYSHKKQILPKIKSTSQTQDKIQSQNSSI